MINPNALPTSPTVQDFQNLESALDGSDYNDTLQAMQYMKRQPTGGLNRLPQVTVPMQAGGMMEEQMPIEPMNEEEVNMKMQEVAQEGPQEPNPQIQAMAQEVASYGRGGDKLLLHINPREMQGLASMLNVTINPVTGQPEVFLNKIAKIFSPVKALAKPIKNIVKSDAFKTLAPIALAIAAPYAAAYMGFGGAAAGASLSAKVAAMGPGMFGFTTGLGSLAGNLLAGRSFKDSAKAALITGATAGTMRGISNKIAGKTFMGDPVQPDTVVASSDTSHLVSQGGQTGDPGAFSYTQKNISPTTTNVASSTPSAGVDMYGGQVGGVSSPTASEQLIADSYQSAAPVNLGGQGVSTQALPTNLGGTIVPGGAPEGFDTQAFLKTADTTPIAGGFDQTVSSIQPGPDPYAPNLLQRTAAKLGEYTPESVKQIGSAIGQDYNPFTKSGLMNIASKGLTGDIGSSYVEMEKQKELLKRQQEEEDEALKRQGYRVEYPDGYDSQRVVYDMSGVVPVRTVEEILNRALGGGKFLYKGKTTFEPTEGLVETAQGGLINLAAGGEFSGMVPGQGGGMDDNVYMPIKEGREQVGTLAVSPTEYVVDSYTMAALGDGNPEEGARVMDKTIKQIRQKAFGNTKQPKEIDGLAALRPMVQGV